MQENKSQKVTHRLDERPSTAKKSPHGHLQVDEYRLKLLMSFLQTNSLLIFV
ncbi:hypothetical protein NSA56_04325 [Oceanobacillus caeni]|uniref:hypothetical protein n=1 Tax=Oceanobacillus caeni TaxID=405946 RepID=UPI0013F4EE76|nr:hypothetical protein [Oceanobacillus caeni]MCR1833621.1 hypothetical protein [Oceanobacillus caeni]